MFSGIGGTQYDMNMTVHTLPGRMMPVDRIVKQNGKEEECKTLANEICTVQVWHHCQSRPPPRDKGAVHLAVSVMRSISCLASKLQIKLLSSKPFFHRNSLRLFWSIIQEARQESCWDPAPHRNRAWLMDIVSCANPDSPGNDMSHLLRSKQRLSFCLQKWRCCNSFITVPLQRSIQVDLIHNKRRRVPVATGRSITVN